MSDRAFPIFTVRDLPATFGYWVYVDESMPLSTHCVQRAQKVVAEPENQPWGERVAQVRDPDGNLVYLRVTL